MADTENVIRVPRIPAGAFNKRRRVSELIWEQVENLAAVVKKQIDDERRAIRTEGQADEYLKTATASERRAIGSSGKSKQGSTRSKAPATSEDAAVSDAKWQRVEDLAAFRKRQIENQRRAVNTEGQASVFIEKMTSLIHPQGVTQTATKPSKSGAKKRPRSAKK